MTVVISNHVKQSHSFTYYFTYLHSSHMGQSIQEWTKPYHFKFIKGCLPQILLGPFLNTLSHIIFQSTKQKLF